MTLGSWDFRDLGLPLALFLRHLEATASGATGEERAACETALDALRFSATIAPRMAPALWWVPAALLRPRTLRLAREILAELAAKARVVIPSGSLQHRVLVELVRTPEAGSAPARYAIRIYNTGVGLEHHRRCTRRGGSASEKFETMYEVLGAQGEGEGAIGVHEVARLLELATHPGRGCLTDPITALYRWAESRGERGPGTGVAQTEQKSNDCCAEVLFAYLRNNLPEGTYKRFKAELMGAAAGAAAAPRGRLADLAFTRPWAPDGRARRQRIAARLEAKAATARARAGSVVR